ncbi:hypothetical protein LPW26_02900 [Rhodopseudomonas sp. HC1]|uniref:hypothetical protein n=1 Tax=Rhodopseudomonas infernalis TaxID=2897386 RepID=UPI001EE7BDF4|nr:hypothetical protein [Rhodopseudomonas infernalis]MCG6203577.1 hypothetical protein [Rhodopseudomonas infernalis]
MPIRTLRHLGAGRGRAAVLLVALGFGTLGLGGCSISVSDMPILGGSERAEQPKDQQGFPAVNDLPANRDEAVLAPAERNKIEQELIAARERQAASNANASAAPAKPAAAK